jgi:hypothetical protein
VSTALIGHTGFVGGLLASAERFDLLIHRANLESLRGAELERLVCAGMPAAKWIANREPDADRANLERLWATLDTVRPRQMVLISTIDVYPRTHGVDETFDCRIEPNHPYGRHRLELEERVRARFPQAQIVRLPALFGPGLKKNIIYDLLHDNGTEAINPESRFQWYPLARLPADLRLVARERLPLVNLFPEPIQTHTLLERFFVGKPVGAKPGPRADYALTTRHSELFAGPPGYVLSAQNVLLELGRYLEAQRAGP